MLIYLIDFISLGGKEKKLKQLEEYLYQSYFAVVFHKGSNKGNLGQALKKIIESSELLNLPYAELQQHSGGSRNIQYRVTGPSTEGIWGCTLRLFLLSNLPNQSLLM